MHVTVNELPAATMVRLIPKDDADRKIIKKMDRQLKGSSAFHILAEIEGEKCMTFMFKPHVPNPPNQPIEKKANKAPEKA